MSPPWVRALSLSTAVQIGDTQLVVRGRIRVGGVGGEQMYVVPRRVGKIQEHWQIVERGAHGTVAVDHDSGALVEWWDGALEEWVDG